jgi:hypothetical protein
MAADLQLFKTCPEIKIIWDATEFLINQQFFLKKGRKTPHSSRKNILSHSGSNLMHFISLKIGGFPLKRGRITFLNDFV